MNVFDIGIVLMLIGYFIGGWKEGIIKEGVSFVGTILIFVVSYSLKGMVGNTLCNVFPFFKLGGLTTLNILIYQLLAFITVASLLSLIFKLVLKLSEKIQKFINKTIIFTIPSKILGGLVGLLKGILIIFIILVCLFLPCRDIKMFTKSTMVNKVLLDTPILSKHTSDIVLSIKEIFDVTSKTSLKEMSRKEANLKSLDIMLKHKVISKKEVKKLIKLKKLDNIKDIDKVLEKY